MKIPAHVWSLERKYLFSLEGVLVFLVFCYQKPNHQFSLHCSFACECRWAWLAQIPLCLVLACY